MTKNGKSGFGLGSLIVIIALVLIVGTYMYYKGNNATPVTEQAGETTYPPTAPSVPVTQMEQGDEVIAPVATTTVATTTPVKK